VTLIADNGEVSNNITVAGSFNAYDLGDINWFMIQNSLGVWTLTSPVDINAGDAFLKFVTNDLFDLPPDYGGDESVITVPVTHAVTFKVTGGTTANRIHLQFPSTAKYDFTLDERRQTFTVQPAPAPERLGSR
jgi:hypothetical protein